MSGSILEANEYLSERHVATLIAAELKRQQEEEKFTQVVLTEDIARDRKNSAAEHYIFRHFDAVSGLGIQKGKPMAIFAYPTTVFNQWGPIDTQILQQIKAYLQYRHESLGEQALEQQDEKAANSNNNPYDFDLYLPLSNGSGSLKKNHNSGGHWNYVVIRFRSPNPDTLNRLQEAIKAEEAKYAKLQQQSLVSQTEVKDILANGQTKLDYLQLMQAEHQARLASFSDKPHDKAAKEAEGQKLSTIKAAISTLQSQEKKSAGQESAISDEAIGILIREALENAKAREFASSSAELKEAMTEDMRTLLASLYNEISIEFTDPMHWSISPEVWRRLANTFPDRKCQGWQQPKQTLPFSPYTALWLIGAAILCFILNAVLAGEILAFLGGFWGMFIIAASLVLIVELGVWLSSMPATPYLSKGNAPQLLTFTLDNHCRQQSNDYTCGDCTAKYMVLKAAGQAQTYSGNIRGTSLGILNQAVELVPAQMPATPRSAPPSPALASDTLSAAALLPNPAVPTSMVPPAAPIGSFSSTQAPVLPQLSKTEESLE